MLAGARANAPWAWEELYRAHAPAVLGYLRSQRAPSPEDLLGEVFVSVVRDLDRFRGSTAAFRGWVVRVAHNRLVDARRAERRRPLLADAPVDAVEPAAAPAETPDAGVLALLGLLPEEQRAVVYLRFVLDLSHAEIAAALGKRAGAVKMLQRRGLDRLAHELERRRYLRGPGGA